MNTYDLIGSIIQSIASIAWPASFVIAVWLFRQKITEILPNMRVKHRETEFSFQQGQSSPPTQPPLSDVSDVHPLPTVNNALQGILSNLQPLPEDQKIPALARALALAQVGVNFEFVFANIFQSQIDFLRVLERKNLTRDEALKFFEDHPNVAANEELKEWGYDKWIEYLVAQGLLIAGYETAVTQKGRDFLQFVDVEKTGFLKVN